MINLDFMRQACLMCDFSSCGYKTGCIAVKNNKIIAKSFNETLTGEIYCQDGFCYREKHNLRGGKDIEKDSMMAQISGALVNLSKKGNDKDIMKKLTQIIDKLNEDNIAAEEP